MIKTSLIILGLVFCLSDNINRADLIGIWQDYPSIGSGWSDNYQIFSNGTIKFNFNEMACEKRTISLIGNWTLTESGVLIMTINQKVILVGGKLVPGTPPSDCKYEIEGGKIETINLDAPEIKKLVLTDNKIDSENDSLETMKVDNKQFWKINKNPNEY
jgi:hypothetical protein